MSEKALTIQREMTPAVWQMIREIAETSAMAQMERAKIAKHLLFCYENELPLSLAVNGGLYTVNNRVEVESTVIRAQIRKHPEYDYAIKELSEKGCTIAIMLHGEILGEASFGEADAKQAGLLGKDNWKAYATDMYLARATSRAYKRFCPDIFMQSVYIRGEVSGTEIVEAEIIDSQPATIQDLISKYGNERVLDAMQSTNGSIGQVYEYLQEVE